MLNQLKHEIKQLGGQVRIVPISFLEEIEHEMKELSKKDNLNNFQKFLINDRFSFDIPEADFEVRSLVIIAYPSLQAKIYFNWSGKRIPFIVPPTYTDYYTAPSKVENSLKPFLDTNEIHVRLATNLPRKLMAAKSGLAQYGRNNICYVEEMGSYFNLIPFYSDIDCNEVDYDEIKQMDECINCRACLNNCPTGAITEDNYMINSEHCLTYLNEAESKYVFPEWISPKAHNAVIGCTICQSICPKNKENLNQFIEPAEFDEEETSQLLGRVPNMQLPKELEQKLIELGLFDYVDAIPRNLKSLMEKENL
jgi:epoxyqueuosine reductase